MRSSVSISLAHSRVKRRRCSGASAGAGRAFMALAALATGVHRLFVLAGKTALAHPRTRLGVVSHRNIPE